MFTKKDLQFLFLYDIGSDTKTAMHNKLFIQANSKKQSYLFAQISENVCFLTEIKKDVTEDFTVLIPVGQMIELLNVCSDDEEVSFNSNGVKFSSGTYSFEQEEYDYSSLSDLLSLVNKKPDKVLNIKDLEKLDIVFPYIGVDGMNTIAVMENYFVAGNRKNSIGAVKTSNTIDDLVYLNSKVILLLSKLSEIKEVDILYYDEDALEMLKIGNTNIIINKLEYTLPNIFEQYREDFLHPNKVIVNKDNILSVLKRIKVVAKNNFENRIELKFNENNIEIVSEENKSSFAKEKVTATVPQNIVGQSMILSINVLLSMIKSLDDNIVFLVEEQKEEPSIATTIQDEKDDKFFIHVIYRSI